MLSSVNSFVYRSDVLDEAGLAAVGEFDHVTDPVGSSASTNTPSMTVPMVGARTIPTTAEKTVTERTRVPRESEEVRRQGDPE